MIPIFTYVSQGSSPVKSGRDLRKESTECYRMNGAGSDVISAGGVDSSREYQPLRMELKRFGWNPFLSAATNDGESRGMTKQSGDIISSVRRFSAHLDHKAFNQEPAAPLSKDHRHHCCCCCCLCHCHKHDRLRDSRPRPRPPPRPPLAVAVSYRHFQVDSLGNQKFPHHRWGQDLCNECVSFSPSIRRFFHICDLGVISHLSDRENREPFAAFASEFVSK